MERRILSSFFSVMLLIPVYSQSGKAKQDTVVGNFKPTGVRLGWDAIGTMKSYLKNDFKGWEVSADVDFRNYYLAVEAGHWARDVTLLNGNYTNSGDYWRVGIDINMMKKDVVKNMFFLGFRIGHSKYDEAMVFSDTTEFGIFNKSISNQGLKANWAELTTGLKVKILKGFWMGYTARMKIFPGFEEDQTLQTYDIPGYGLTYKKPWWGFNYYLMFRIPISKER